MASKKLQFFILTGDPGVGKTTLTKKVSSAIASKGCGIQGFYTEEVRKNGVREGFDIVTINGKRGRLARQQNLLSCPVKYKVGKYGVLIDEFENIALPSLEKSVPDNEKSLLVIDEIGKMEFFSEPFKSVMRNVFSQKSQFIALATIPVKSSDKFIESLRNDSRAKVWTITRENIMNIHEDIINDIITALHIS